VRKAGLFVVCGYLLTASATLFGASSPSTTAGSTGTNATTLLNQLSTAFSGLPLLICGSLKIVYDITLLLSFRHMKPPEECDARDEAVRTSAQECADGVDR